MQLASTQIVEDVCIALLSHLADNLLWTGIKTISPFTPDVCPRLLQPFLPGLFAAGPGSQTVVMVDGDDNDQRLSAPLDDHGLLTINNGAHEFTEVNTCFGGTDRSRHDVPRPMGWQRSRTSPRQTHTKTRHPRL